MKNNVLLAVAAVLLMAGGCAEKNEEAAGKKDSKFCISPDLKAKITIGTVKKEPVAETIALTGNVTYNADDVVQFSSLVSGVITGTHFSLGDYVKKGQVLAEIKSTELNSLKSERVSLQSQLQVAQRQLQSVKSMFNDGIASQSDLLKAQS
ncbi:MAG: biotin/lipoyl-binding protein, partial [Sphingobacteriales bacterium]